MFKNKNLTSVDDMGEPLRVGEWERKNLLGSGGFGTVYLWTCKTTGESLAIKKCKWRLQDNLTPKQKERWSLEVEMMRKTQNENIVGYRKMPEILEKALLNCNLSGVPILSMEYCRLGSLRDMLSIPENCCGICESEVINILKDTSNALKYLHKLNITHRDFKPENIVLQECNRRKSGRIYKLIDLGYAKEIGDSTVSFVGTLQYLAPEIFQKQNYDNSVDYWSFGITAFEIICGIRPFLPNYAPIESFKEVKKKASDVISIHFTHTGDMKSSKELLRETSINMYLKQNMEKWFQSVLQYEPEKRGFIDNRNINVFEKLQEIISKKFITVFSVYTYEFYSYEVDEGTLYSTLQDWISRDVKIYKMDQFLIPSKIIESNYVLDYCVEENSEPSLFIFKKDTCINENLRTNLPKLIRAFFENLQTEFKFGTFRLLHVQVIYFILQEMKHLNALISSICGLYDYLQHSYTVENKLFVDIKSLIKSFLSEIEFYNKIETMLNMKMYKHAKDDNNVKLNKYLLEYKNYMHQLQEIIDVINAVSQRHYKVITRNHHLLHASDLVLAKLREYDFKSLLQQAVKCYEEVLKTNPNKNLTGSIDILNITSSTIKIRDEILHNERMQNLLKACTKFSKELNKLITGMKRINESTKKIKEDVRQNVIKRLEILQDKSYNVVDISIEAKTLIDVNVLLRYELQELMNASTLKYKTTLDIDEEISLCDSIENGFDY
ncbi:hypothetical protein ILUMI_05533 [Ignelater luminosus]|uniref:IkappaB kinase n=1 Tax=Ignelater luminosus TaxID=2038154 RepID=A0A8K0D7I8_IGNLU|nr:hypothetical protein ILUMI_05533 [Ignelater luminosus]